MARALRGLCAAVLLANTIWVVVPPPFLALALLAVPLSGGWGLTLGFVALVLAAWCAARREYAGVTLALAASLCGLAPLPPLLSAAHHEGVALSVTRAMLTGIDAPAAAELSVEFRRAAGQSLKLDVIPATTRAEAVRSGPSRTGEREYSRAVIVVHGGGWSAGERGECATANARLAAMGFTVFAVDYRLSPQPNWDAAYEDLRLAVDWVVTHAHEYGARTEGLVLLGRSAGAHLALLTAYADARVAAVVAFYGPTDLAYGYHHPANMRVYDGPAKLTAFLGGDPATLPERYAAMSPLLTVSSRGPRTLLFHGDRDQFVGLEQQERLAARLEQLGVEHRSVVIPFGQHGFDHATDALGTQLAAGVLCQFLSGHCRR